MSRKASLFLIYYKIFKTYGVFFYNYVDFVFGICKWREANLRMNVRGRIILDHDKPLKAIGKWPLATSERK